MNQHQHDAQNKMHLTILVDGIPKEEDFVSNLKVEEVIKKLLPPGEKQNWEKYILSDREKKLDASNSLEDNGVKENDVLSLTQKDGGGGHIDF